MQREVIGVVGCYSHDVILMLAKVLSNMGKKVILFDCNNRHTLGASIPVPAGMSAQKAVVEFDGIYYTEKEPERGLMAGYDVCFVDMGMGNQEIKQVSCNRIILITDMLLHHIRQLHKMKFEKQLVQYILIRDAVSILMMGEKEVREFLQGFPNRQEFFLPPDRRDVKNRCLCETMHEYNIKKASPEMREFVYRIAMELCGGLTEREFCRRLRRRERREYA